MFFKKKTPLSRALKEFNNKNSEEKCQIDIIHKGEIISQVFNAHIFADLYEFSNNQDIAIVAKKRPSENLIHEWGIDCLEIDSNKIIILCNKKKIIVEHLILIMIKEDLGNVDRNIEMDIQMNCY